MSVTPARTAPRSTPPATPDDYGQPLTDAARGRQGALRRSRASRGHRPGALHPDLAPFALCPVHRLLDLPDEPDAGRRAQGDELRQVAGPSGWPWTRPRSPSRDVAGVDEAVEELQEIKEFLENPKKFQQPGRAHPQGGAALRPPRHRQDPAGPRRGRRGRGALLLDLRLGLRRDVRRGRAPAGCATSSSRPSRTAPASSSWTRSTPSAATAARASAAATTSASRPSTSSWSRWTALRPRTTSS